MLRAIILLLTISTPLSAQDFSQLQVEEVATGFKGGEGSVWSREGFLLFSDYSQDRIYKYIPGKAPEVYREGSNGANGNTMDRRDACTRASTRPGGSPGPTAQGGSRSLSTGSKANGSTRPTTSWCGAMDTSISPTPCHPARCAGPGFLRDLPCHAERPDRGDRADADTAQRRHAVAGRQILYVGNERRILAYDLNRDGQASNERVIIADLPGGPDGIRTDAKGNLYLTSGGIAVYSPAGQLLGRITLPGVARNLAFGDKDLRTLYMIGNSLYRVRVPIPGSIRY